MGLFLLPKNICILRLESISLVEAIFESKLSTSIGHWKLILQNYVTLAQTKFTFSFLGVFIFHFTIKFDIPFDII